MLNSFKTANLPRIVGILLVCFTVFLLPKSIVANHQLINIKTIIIVAIIALSFNLFYIKINLHKINILLLLLMLIYYGCKFYFGIYLTALQNATLDGILLSIILITITITNIYYQNLKNFLINKTILINASMLFGIGLISSLIINGLIINYIISDILIYGFDSKIINAVFTAIVHMQQYCHIKACSISDYITPMVIINTATSIIYIIFIELIFRWVYFNKLQQNYNNIIAISITAVGAALFSNTLQASLFNNLTILIVLIIYNFLWGYIRIITKHIYANIVIQATVLTVFNITAYNTSFVLTQHLSP